MELSDPRLDALIGRLDLRAKVRLLTGQDFWSTWGLEEIGLRSMVVSDGPSGVRGPIWDERSPSLNLPSATALASTWDVDIAAEYGAVSAAEARRKGVDVVLGPTINLHRSPLGGRHFESFSEDPFLTAELAAAYVAGVQENGVGATPKHYVANDFETDRFTVDVQVGERALRELYLAAFEKAVRESHAWLVMSAYNSVNGATVTENELLETPLNSEWGFDGVVVSDWTAVRSIESARHSQDLAMPGPDGAWGEALVAAVETGQVSEASIDRKVRRLLLLAARVGALEGFESLPVAEIDGVEFARRAESAGTVLVENRGILPLIDAPARIAVIGHNALVARSQGGGSATVIPEHVVSPLEGIRHAFPGAEVTYALGAIVQHGIVDIPLDELRNPATGESGLRVEFLDAEGRVLFHENRFASSLVWLGSDAPTRECSQVRISTRWTPAADGPVLLGFAGVGRGVVSVDGTTILDSAADPVGTDLGAALLEPPSRSGPFDVHAGQSYDVTLVFTPRRADGGLSSALSLAFGTEAEEGDRDGLIDEAQRAAADADVVVLVVGTNSKVESEGYDRADLRLPGAQDHLAAAVIAANPRTIVVVNSGSPVELPWAADASAVLLTWFGGQEYGHALADVLTGSVEPGGRLPTTWPAEMTDVPVLDVTPAGGVVAYEEGIHIGYRAWLRSGGRPAYWFGHGLGYTTFDIESADAPSTASPGSGLVVSVGVRNTGDRSGKFVAQIYASRADSTIERPVRWLVGFEVAHLDVGELRHIQVAIPGRAFAHWGDGGWGYEAGRFELSLAAHAGAPGIRLPVLVQ